ncbi:MAG: hypothetical protein ACD_75C02348G0003 [uncultured bacterium]|nr:MAG: hypothetical protein ACD_75C02348G0003 [uncultured bacterium]
MTSKVEISQRECQTSGTCRPGQWAMTAATITKMRSTYHIDRRKVPIPLLERIAVRAGCAARTCDRTERLPRSLF